MKKREVLLLRHVVRTVSINWFYPCVACFERSCAMTGVQSMTFTFILIMIATTKLYFKLSRMPTMTLTQMRYFACDGAAGGTPEMIKQME